MKAMILASLVLLLVAQYPARAARIIDAGELEVNGEVRKPFLTFLDSDQAALNALPVLSVAALKAFEEKLLKFAEPEHANP